jgi:hypothetical protein
VLGILLACTLLLVSAGLAIAALLGLALLTLCLASTLLERRNSRRPRGEDQLPYTAKKSRSSGSR